MGELWLISTAKNAISPERFVIIATAVDVIKTSLTREVVFVVAICLIATGATHIGNNLGKFASVRRDNVPVCLAHSFFLVE